MFGKVASDLLSGVAIEDHAVSGTLNWVEGYTGFSSNPAEQLGNYIALTVDTEALGEQLDDCVITCHIGENDVVLDSDKTIVIRYTGRVDEISFTAEKEGYTTGVITLDLSTLTLTPEPAKFSLVCNTPGITFAPSGQMAGGTATFEITATGQVPYDTTTSSNLINMTLTTNASPTYDLTDDSILIAYLDSEETAHTLYTGSLTWSDNVGTATFNCPITADSITYSPVIAIVVDGTNATRVSQVLDTSALTLEPEPGPTLIGIPGGTFRISGADYSSSDFVSSSSVSTTTYGTENDPWIITATLKAHNSSAPYGYIIPLCFYTDNDTWNKVVLNAEYNYDGIFRSTTLNNTGIASGEMSRMYFAVLQSYNNNNAPIFNAHFTNTRTGTYMDKYFKLILTLDGLDNRPANNAIYVAPPSDMQIAINSNTYAVGDLQTNVVVDEVNKTITGLLKMASGLNYYYRVLMLSQIPTEATISSYKGGAGLSSSAPITSLQSITYNGDTYWIYLQTLTSATSVLGGAVLKYGTISTNDTITFLKIYDTSNMTVETYANGNDLFTIPMGGFTRTQASVLETLSSKGEVNVDGSLLQLVLASPLSLGRSYDLFTDKVGNAISDYLMNTYDPITATVVNGITEYTIGGGAATSYERGEINALDCSITGTNTASSDSNCFAQRFGNAGNYLVCDGTNFVSTLGGAKGFTAVANSNDLVVNYILSFAIPPSKRYRISVDGVNWTTIGNAVAGNNFTFVPVMIKVYINDETPAPKLSTIYIDPNTASLSNNIIKINIPSSLYTW